MAGGWIQRAIKHRGALRSWVRRNRKAIRRATGKPALTKRGTINPAALAALRRTRYYQRLSPTVKRRINLALTLNRLRRKKKK